MQVEHGHPVPVCSGDHPRLIVTYPVDHLDGLFSSLNFGISLIKKKNAHWEFIVDSAMHLLEEGEEPIFNIKLV